MVKYFKPVSTQLEMNRYNKLVEICKKEGCTVYAITRDLLTDYIKSYPKEGEKHERGEETEREDSGRAGEPEEDIE